MLGRVKCLAEGRRCLMLGKKMWASYSVKGWFRLGKVRLSFSPNPGGEKYFFYTMIGVV